MKKTFLLLFSILLLGTTFTFNSCQPEIPEVTDGKDGQDGQDGSDGTDGLSIVIDMQEATTEQCPSGGRVIVFAYDTNFNNQFDDKDRVVNQIPICNGSDGVNCWDLNQNGQPDTSEDINEDGVVNVEDCKAGEVIYNVVAIPKDDERCAGNGGWSVSFGVDKNNNSQLDPDEVRETFNVCNGAPGQDGRNGIDGLTAIGIVMGFETVDQCTTISFYYDSGATKSVVDEGDTFINKITVCDGQNGTNGSDGNDVTFSSTPFSTSEQCPGGGNLITIFVNGVENISFEVCNGQGQEQSFIVYSIIQDPEQCGDRGGVRLDVYDDVDGDGVLNPNIDFFLESFTICMGMNAAQVLAIGYEIDDYVDIDIQIVQGSDRCPSDPNGSVITVFVESDFLIKFALCNNQYLPTVTITNVVISNITTTSFQVATTLDKGAKLNIEYGTEPGVYQWTTTREENFLTTHTQTVGNGNPINLTPGVTYYWRIYVEGEDGNGGYSSERSTTTLSQ